MIQYKGPDGDFLLPDAGETSGLYFPLVNETGFTSAIAPDLGGDAKGGHNSYLLEPASKETLLNTKATRNVWCIPAEGKPWSISGRSAWQQALHFTQQAEKTAVQGGLLWQRVQHENAEVGLAAGVLSFVPVGGGQCEIMQVTIANTGMEAYTFTPLVAVPLYARSADNLRDHRHVTSLLHRIKTCADGATVTPALTFDERGHKPNETVYGVYAMQDDSMLPQDFCPLTDDFIGEGGSLEWPAAAVCPETVKWVGAGEDMAGYEATGGIRFAPCTLAPGESTTLCILLAIGAVDKALLKAAGVQAALARTQAHWRGVSGAAFETADARFDAWMQWVCIQPELRRICGNSFLPHHDYGRGGRGWRDLWQDCLALILQRPEKVRAKLIQYMGGVRMDGSNATIIGSEDGQFIADRNQIVRVWMDHGVWPARTVCFYIQQTGDTAILLEEDVYFKDAQVCRGEGRDEKWMPAQGTRVRMADGKDYHGTVLEHLLTQMVTAFYDVGEHGHIRLRGADWNDGMDMAATRGESVAFTAAYAESMDLLADALDLLARTEKPQGVWLAAEIAPLLRQSMSALEDAGEKRALLAAYCQSVQGTVSGEKVEYAPQALSALLRLMSGWIKEHIRQTEWIQETPERGWFNGYYDDHGRALEKAEGPRMLLTSQVFTMLSGTATQAQAEAIIRAVDAYLYHPQRGGYALNTDFDEVKLDMGRMFGFAYGHKENGAVFSHMAVMYAYALYSRGYAREGYKALAALYRQADSFAVSRMYPGIPEYFDIRGRGMYPYLTGSASWYALAVQTLAFGMRGEGGNLKIAPQLVAEQFGEDGTAVLTAPFAGRTLRLVLHNPERLDPAAYQVGEARMAGRTYSGRCGAVCIAREAVLALPEEGTHQVDVYLVAREGGQ